MNEDIIKNLHELFKKSPILCSGPVTLPEINGMETQLGFKLPADYREFVELFGGAIVGPYRIYGLRASQAMGAQEASALAVTKRFRLDRWPATDQWLVISMDHSGNPVGLDAEGKVWISDHDSRRIQPLAATFEDFLRKWCLKQ